MTTNIVLQGGIFHNFTETSDAVGRVLHPLGVKSLTFDDVEQGLAHLSKTRDALLTINALRWEMVGEKYDPFREEWQFSLSQSGKNIILAHLGRGGAILAIHTASICFSDWDEWKEILGGFWNWGTSWHPSPELINLKSTNHELSIGLDFSVTDELYTDLELRDSAEIVLRGSSAASPDPQPVLWLNEYGTGRVVYDSLGHEPDSLLQQDHAALIRSAVSWALNLKV